MLFIIINILISFIIINILISFIIIINILISLTILYYFFNRTQTTLHKLLLQNQHINPTPAARVLEIINFLKRSEDQAYPAFRECIIKIGRRSLLERFLPLTEETTTPFQEKRSVDGLNRMSCKSGPALSSFTLTGIYLYIPLITGRYNK